MDHTMCGGWTWPPALGFQPTSSPATHLRWLQGCCSVASRWELRWESIVLLRLRPDPATASKQADPGASMGWLTEGRGASNQAELSATLRHQHPACSPGSRDSGAG